MSEQGKLLNDPPAFTPKQLVECVERELQRRRTRYPDLVKGGRMTTGQREREIALMQAVLERIKAYAAYADRRDA